MVPFVNTKSILFIKSLGVELPKLKRYKKINFHLTSKKKEKLEIVIKIPFQKCCVKIKEKNHHLATVSHQIKLRPIEFIMPE